VSHLFWPGAGGAVAEEDIQAAEEKFNESKLLAEAAMHNLLENDVRNFQHFMIFCTFCIYIVAPISAVGRLLFQAQRLKLAARLSPWSIA